MLTKLISVCLLLGVYCLVNSNAYSAQGACVRYFLEHTGKYFEELSDESHRFYVLGEGNFGKVFRVQSTSDATQRALKLYNPESEKIFQNDRLLFKILNEAQERGVDFGFNVIAAKDGPFPLSLDMEYSHGTDLQKLLKDNVAPLEIRGTLASLYAERAERYVQFWGDNFNVLKVRRGTYYDQIEIQITIEDPTGESLRVNSDGTRVLTVVLKIDNVLVPGTDPPQNFPMTIIDPF